MNRLEAQNAERALIFEYVKEIGVQERHFNQLCARYKILASSWLLATFAGIGFVATKLGNHYILFAIIGLVGSVGVYLLKTIDLGIYQRLTVASFDEGLALEEEHTWLPQFRKKMVRAQERGTYRSVLLRFYTIGILLPLLGALVSVLYLAQVQIDCSAGFATAFLLSPLFGILAARLLRSDRQEASNGHDRSTDAGPIAQLRNSVLASGVAFIVLVSANWMHAPSLCATEVITAGSASCSCVKPNTERVDSVDEQ